jgi:hypothetical protein
MLPVARSDSGGASEPDAEPFMIAFRELLARMLHGEEKGTG